jgi:hypothetical protein
MCPCGKYTTTLFFFGSEISGPAHACHSSRHTDEAEAEAAAEAEALRAGAEHHDEAEESEDGVSSSSVVLRSIRPMKSKAPQE